jgi:2-polyprenyl-3-methyl-5-hydroxy-6-metoxy-1,4-benzoquinol methylase
MPQEQLPDQNFYNDNAETYCQATVKVDMGDARERFLRMLQPGARILDAGCGSGRDMRAFMLRGFLVSGFDASSQMASYASSYSGRTCEILRFQDMQFHNEFDGVWSCASLLHVPKHDMEDVMNRLVNSLKLNGVAYFSFIEGEGERVSSDGRFYNSYTSDSLRTLLRKIGRVREVESWTSVDSGAQSRPAPWLNMIVQKLSSKEGSCI